MEKILSECATAAEFLSGSNVVRSRPPMTTSASASSSSAVRPRPRSGSSPSAPVRKARLSPGSCARSPSSLWLERYRRNGALFTQDVSDRAQTARPPAAGCSLCRSSPDQRGGRIPDKAKKEAAPAMPADGIVF